MGPKAVQATVSALTARHGPTQAERIRRGVRQAAQRWWPSDGDEAAFQAFCEEAFLADPADLEAAASRLGRVLEQVDGLLFEARRELTYPMDTDTGPLRPWDVYLSEVDPAAHLTDDLFRSRVGFLAVLNFPLHSLGQRLSSGPNWSRAQWARSRLMDRFSLRVPARVLQDATRAFAEADRYISAYNIRMDRLVTPSGEHLFPEGLRLISHWGLRDELKAGYVDGAAGLARQRQIARVMERIVRQEIPAAVLDNPSIDWCPETNEVRPHDPGTALPAGASDREPDTRYARWLGVFHAVREVDPYSPTAPTFIARRFELDRQIPEDQVEAMLVAVLESREVRDLAKRIRNRLGRPLEPFDIWYAGFTPRAAHGEAELDAAVRAKYPDLSAFQADLPDLLRRLGFAPDKADWLAAHIVVDPARGAGHAMGAVRREDKAHLRTRVPADGMDYKGFNVALHELGHNVEQVFSLNGMDEWALAGVPNNAFTEAMAYQFQGRDLEVLGLAPPSEEARHLAVLAELWATYEISGVALVDLGAWHWMYDHPDATAAQLREAVRTIARDVWNRWYAPVFGVKDAEILAIYSHTVVYGLYIPDYAVGHLVSFQVGQALQKGPFGAEVERVTRLGRLTPDLWMRQAVGQGLSAQPLLAAAREALARTR
ncbi:MAG: hypothetical protein JXB39_01715 [Deltaproteobacteria bacterium]|nr:hypothetical protein [Deltaproteobacteria bacterium]